MRVRVPPGTPEMDQIAEIKAKTDIVELIGEYLPLKKAGRNYVALCPFHHEKTPSFTVSPELQIFKCFGCGASGDVIKFLQMYEQMDFWEAVEFLARRVGVKLERRQFSPQEKQRRQIYALNQAAAQFYHFLLQKHPLGEPARRYLQQRGLRPETVEKFQLGFSPRQGTALTQYLLQKKKFSPAELEQSGIFFRLQRPVNGFQLFDRFHGRLVFPLYDHRGNIVSFSGRLIPGLLENEDQRGKYINGPETLAYHKSRHLFGLYFSREALRQEKTAIIVEGEFDFLSSWQAGVQNVIAIKGTAFTSEQIQLLRRFVSRLNLALDADFAGNQAALRSINLAENAGLEVHVIHWTGKAKDPDELARSDPRRWRQVVQKTVPVWDFVIQTACQRFGTQTPAAKKQVLAAVLPFLRQIDNQVVQLDYYRRLASALDTEVEAIIAEANKLAVETAARPAEKPVPATPPPDRATLLEEYLLALILSSPQPARYRFRPHDFALKRIYRQLRNFLKKRKAWRVGDFVQTLPAELQTKIQDLLLRWHDLPADLEREIEKTKREWQKLRWRQQLADLSRQIAQAEKGDRQQLAALEEKFQKISQRLIALEKEK